MGKTRLIKDFIKDKLAFYFPATKEVESQRMKRLAGVIAEGNHKLGKIAGAMEIETSGLSSYLSTLSDLGFIVKDTPVTEKNPEKSRKGLYFISDNFVRFCFRYVYPYKGGAGFG